jgi:uncharacterized protein (UPF0303 family)
MPDAHAFPTLDELQAEERELELASMTEADAWELGSLAVARAREAAMPVAIAVWRAGRQLFHSALPVLAATLGEDARVTLAADEAA